MVVPVVPGLTPTRDLWLVVNVRVVARIARQSCDLSLTNRTSFTHLFFVSRS
jgi:hypothetical protein